MAVHHLPDDLLDIPVIKPISAAPVIRLKPDRSRSFPCIPSDGADPPFGIPGHGDADDLLLAPCQFLSRHKPSLGHAGAAGVEDVGKPYPAFLLPPSNLFIGPHISRSCRLLVAHAPGIAVKVVRLISLPL